MGHVVKEFLESDLGSNLERTQDPASPAAP